MTIESKRAVLRAVRGPTRLQKALQALPKGGMERQAVAAGEVDAIIDYANSNIIMFPAARRTLRHGATVADAPAAHGTRVDNAVLAALPREDYEQLLAGLEAVHLEQGQMLHEEGTAFRYIYFPIDCVVCLLTATQGKRKVITGLVGCEGMVGMSLLFGVAASPVCAEVLAAGSALRMRADHFCIELSRCPALQGGLYRHAYLELGQARHTIACMSSSRLEQRVASMLLMISDRSRLQTVLLTQERLATVLHARRVSITLASASLRSRKLVRYNRGAIEILNRKGLEATSCSCYKRMGDLRTA